MQRPDFLDEKNKPYQISLCYKFIKTINFLPFSHLIYSDENSMTKLVVDTWGNYFNKIVSVIVQLDPNGHDFQKQPFTNVLQNRCSYKFLKIHMKTPYTCNSVKKILQRRCFPVNLAKFLKTLFLKNTSGRLLLVFSFVLLFFATQWTNRNEFFSIFEHVLSRLSNVMNTMNLVTGKLYFTKQTKALSNIY